MSLKALPYPSLKVQKRLRWTDSNWGVRLRQGRAASWVLPRTTPCARACPLAAMARGRPGSRGRAAWLQPAHRGCRWLAYQLPCLALPCLACCLWLRMCPPGRSPRPAPPWVQLRVPIGVPEHLLPPARAPHAVYRQHAQQRGAADAGGPRAAAARAPSRQAERAVSVHLQVPLPVLCGRRECHT